MYFKRMTAGLSATIVLFTTVVSASTSNASDDFFESDHIVYTGRVQPATTRMLEESYPFEHWFIDYSIIDRYTMAEISEMLNIPMDLLEEAQESDEVLYRTNIAMLFSSISELAQPRNQ